MTGQDIDGDYSSAFEQFVNMFDSSPAPRPNPEKFTRKFNQFTSRVGQTAKYCRKYERFQDYSDNLMKRQDYTKRRNERCGL